MKKIADSFGMSFTSPSVALNRSDLDDILVVLKDAKKVTIICGKYQYDSLDELKSEVGDYAPELSITSSEPYLSLRFSRKLSALGTSTWLYIDAPDDKTALSMFLEIKEILMEKKLFMARILPVWLSCAAWILFVTLPIFSQLIMHMNLASKHALILLLIILLFMPGLLRVGFWYSISLAHEKDKSSFLKRNGDDILKLLIGAAITLLIQWIIKRF